MVAPFRPASTETVRLAILSMIRRGPAVAVVLVALVIVVLRVAATSWIEADVAFSVLRDRPVDCKRDVTVVVPERGCTILTTSSSLQTSSCERGGRAVIPLRGVEVAL